MVMPGSVGNTAIESSGGAVGVQARNDPITVNLKDTRIECFTHQQGRNPFQYPSRNGTFTRINWLPDG
jgi:hypothetical protein